MTHDRATGYVERATAHEHYRYNVWYNVELIDLIGMTATEVDIVTEIIRNNTAAANRPIHVLAYLERIRRIVSCSFCSFRRHLKIWQRYICRIFMSMYCTSRWFGVRQSLHPPPYVHSLLNSR